VVARLLVVLAGAAELAGRRLGRALQSLQEDARLVRQLRQQTGGQPLQQAVDVGERLPERLLAGLAQQRCRQPDGAGRGTGRDLRRQRLGDEPVELVRLVEDDDVALGQHLRVGAHVEREHRVVGDDDVGGRRLGLGDLGEAVLPVRAGGAEAVAAVDAERPPGDVVERERHLVAVAGRGVLGPAAQLLHLRLQPAAGAEVEVVGVLHAVHALQAQVVAPALGDRERDLPLAALPHRRGHPRQVLVHELVLQRLGRGADQHAPAARQDAGEVADRLAGPGAGLHEQVPVVLHRLGHLAHHLALTLTRVAVRQVAEHDVEQGQRVLGLGSWLYAQLVQAADDVAGLPGGFLDQLQPGQAAQHRAERGLQLEPGQRGAEAEVHARAEGDVRVRVASDVERVRLAEDRGVAVGRAEQQAELGAARHRTPPISRSSSTQRSNICSGVSQRISSSTAWAAGRGRRAAGSAGRGCGTATTSRCR
jgi:hypothetical protein